jgi:YD repeat-containing protein
MDTPGGERLELRWDAANRVGSVKQQAGKTTAYKIVGWKQMA